MWLSLDPTAVTVEYGLEAVSLRATYVGPKCLGNELQLSAIVLWMPAGIITYHQGPKSQNSGCYVSNQQYSLAASLIYTVFQVSQ